MTFDVSSISFGEEIVTATELNRQSGQVLDKALDHPVTITRNDEHFTLLPRNEVAYLVKAVKHSDSLFESLTVAILLLTGKEIGYEHPFGWLSVFDSDDLQEFIKEVTTAYRLINCQTRSWDNIGAIIHEWHESAIAIQSTELAIAFSDEFDEVPLTNPSTQNAV